MSQYCPARKRKVLYLPLRCEAARELVGKHCTATYVAMSATIPFPIDSTCVALTCLTSIRLHYKYTTTRTSTIAPLSPAPIATIDAAQLAVLFYSLGCILVPTSVSPRWNSLVHIAFSVYCPESASCLLPLVLLV
jgi:hypothetical protein